jgi:uncharacterized protein (DUF58 family)
VNRIFLLGVVGYGLAILGLATLSGGILALVIPLLIFLGTGLLYGPEEPRLEITRRLDADRAEPGTPVQVTLTITNQGRILELVHIVDAPPRMLQVIDGETEAVASLDTGETIQLQYRLSGKRGRYDFGKVQVRATDFLGVLERKTETAVSGLLELFIYPDVSRIDRIPIRPRQTKAYAGHIPSRLGGTGVDFFGVRNYHAGDELRHINWRANARHQETFFTNEFEQERVADVGIILDARQRTNVLRGRYSLFEHAIQAAASLADSFLSDGNRVGFLRYGDLLDWTIPGYGKRQRERILQALARARTGDSLIFDKLEHLPARLFPAKSQIVLVSPLASDDTEMLPRLRARGYQVLVISPDPIAFELSVLEPSEIVTTAGRIARVERELLFRRLRQSGIRVFNWKTSIPLDRALGSSLAALRPTMERNVGIQPW